MLTLGKIFSDFLLPFSYPLFDKIFFLGVREMKHTMDSTPLLTNVCASRITS